jgi:hypothetical protein
MESKPRRTFRRCGACRRGWQTPEEFLDDPQLLAVGLQVAPHLPESNLLVFEHSCGSSVSVLTRRLRFLLPEPYEGADTTDLYGAQECSLYCRRLEEWALCDRPCVNARDRRLLKLILHRKGQSAPGTPTG